METGEQLQLFTRVRSSRSERSKGLVEALKGKSWVNRRILAAQLKWSLRYVRLVASGSDEIISAPGSAGYKLLSEATLDEYLRYRSSRRNQAREMIAKIVRTDRVFYARQSVKEMAS